ncbi:MAG TPA: diadenylate cyclase CdaA [Gemmatimonadales bacterium]|nr:diadenylate cyclase CdaA [Gemmatimonadales bacterium]
MDRFQFLIPTWLDVLEIAIVAYVIYRGLLFLVGTRAIQILLGLVLLGVAYIGALLLKLQMISYLLGIILTYGAFALLIVFQPELRSGLARLGQSRLMRFFYRGEAHHAAAEVREAVDRLSRSGTGAIIAVESEVGLGDYVATGTRLEARVSADLITTIFTPYSPLHDGAVVIRGDTIIGAGVILPLTQFPVTDKSLGTRHRAALGLTEETDALVVVVSEETSTISVARKGQLERGVSLERLEELLASGPFARIGGPVVET